MHTIATNGTQPGNVVLGGKLTADLGGSAFGTLLVSRWEPSDRFVFHLELPEHYAVWMAHPFHWDVFSLGLAINVVSYARGAAA